MAASRQQTSRCASSAITVDNRGMAYLPALRTPFAGFHRIPAAPPAPTPLATKPDPKAAVARRLHAQDQARRTTSVAPPS